MSSWLTAALNKAVVVTPTSSDKDSVGFKAYKNKAFIVKGGAMTNRHLKLSVTVLGFAHKKHPRKKNFQGFKLETFLCDHN